MYKNSSDASTIVYPDNTYGKDGYYKIFDDSEKLRNEFRNVLTTDLEKYSCKLHALLNNVKNSPGTVFIYSNYVNYGGTSIIKHVLNINGYTEYPGKEDYSYIMYDESNNVNQRENLRRLFNSSDNKNGKNIKIIIGSPIISEGITLKNVRQVHILEPCWNMSRINQIIGRAIRNNSHADLTPEQRNVDIFKYVSVYPRIKNDDNENSLLRFFIDREKYILSEEKDRANKKIERLLKEISFDCSFMLDRNSISEEYSGLAICDYTNCKYLCNKDHVKNEDGKLERSDKSDKSTYNLYIDFFNKEDIKWIKLIIEKLFKIYFIWTISDIFEHIKKLEPYVTREAVITTLELLITNKTILVDMYNRDGFLIKRGDYYIFNGLDIDIESSIYEKFFNFEVDVNKYTLLDYANSVNLDVEIKEKVVKKKQQLVDIDPEIVTYNDNLMTKTGIIGSRRARGIKNSYGPIDNDFRIIDLRNEKGKETVDNRKIITGMRLISFKKAQLLDFAKYLNIPNIDEDDKGVDIGTSIEKFLTKNNLVLK